METTKIYLSGGMSGIDWQADVIKRVSDSKQKSLTKNYVFFNPREHNLIHTKEYTFWDLYYIKNCDLIFAYMHEDNPSGYGLTLEIGYASALGKPIILIDEKSVNNEKFSSSFSIVKETSNIVFDNLEEGIQFLIKLRNGILSV